MSKQSKPYAIRPRVFLFACDVVRAFPKSRLDTPSLKAWSQLVASATSTGAHLEEASAGGTRAHFLSLTRGALREMRESNYWLRLIATTELSGFKQTPALIQESSELTAILATIVRRTHATNDKQRPNSKEK